ncbi:MAG: electron transfer flavoprotein subunit alpha/FixB family protein, partial [Verrucomicrobia bacterium]|nr:electron transfer flavoprotein subunit alpha/FixB family protein [Verrucomicrobiota bacterium]
HRGAIAGITFELLGAARDLARALSGSVHAVLLGHDVAPLASGLGSADRVWVLDDPSAATPSAELTLAVLQAQAARHATAIILLGGTNVSFGLGARLSARTNLPFVNFCQGLRVEGGGIVCTSRLYGGKIFADVRLPANQGILGIAPGSFPAAIGDGAPPPGVEHLPVPTHPAPVQFKRFIEPAAGDIDITKQDVLVSVGRGIQEAGNIPLAEELARALRGAVSASRPVVDQGWLPLTRQVGKSGMTVKPKLYLALGVSGAPEHLEGMKDAALIVAINTDPKAPIFDLAHFGATVDCVELIEALAAAVRERTAAG